MDNRRTLVVGSGSTRLAASTPVLERQGLAVDRVSSPQTALELARHVKFHLALLDYPPVGITVGEMAQGLRSAAGPHHRTYVVLVAPPEKIEEARAYVDAGVDAVLSAAAEPEEAARVLHEVLGAPRRVGVRVPVRLEVGLQEGPMLVFRQTEDLSATGMLVRTPTALPPGTEASFRLDLPGARTAIEGRARVVRQVLDVDGHTVLATGMLFVSFKGDGDTRLKTFVESAVRAQG